MLDAPESGAGESPFVIAAIRPRRLTGARVSGNLALRWTYVDLERAALRLPDSKTGPKVIRLDPRALEVLTSLPRVKDSPHVIVGKREGGALVNLQKPWERIRHLARIDDVHIHDLRHSFASMSVAAGASLPMIGKMLGHSQPRTTARYAHLADDPLRQINDQVGDAITAALKRS